MCSQTWKRCLKCKDCRNVKSIKSIPKNGVKINKIKKNCQIIAKNAINVYENCDCYNERENVTKRMYFLFEYLNCGKKPLFIADYFI